MRFTKYNKLYVIAVIIICLLEWLCDVANVCLWLLSSASIVAGCSNAILTYKNTKIYIADIFLLTHTHTHTHTRTDANKPYFCQHSLNIVVVVIVQIRVAENPISGAHCL